MKKSILVPTLVIPAIPAIPALLVAMSLLGRSEAGPFGAKPDGFAGMHSLAAISWGVGAYCLGLTRIGLILVGIETLQRHKFDSK